MINNVVITSLNKKLRFLINHVNNFFNEKNDKMSVISVYQFNIEMTVQLFNIENHKIIKLYINALIKY